MFYLPLTATPLGWVILGASGYMLYKAGKKKGEEEAVAAQIQELPPVLPTQDSPETTEEGEK